jgi:hypothetical protein
MRRFVSSAVLAAVMVVGLAAGPASAAAAVKSGSVSCEIFQRGGVQASAQRDVAGRAPGGPSFAYDWGTWTSKTYRVNGTASGGGSWSVESHSILNTGSSFGYCHGG